ncbi:MAG: ATP-binding protein [Planctomycetota bacterium]|nr:ATP-binding protein [Planctomycetota bacterium]
MSVGRWLSLGVGLTGAFLVIALMGLGPGWGHAGAQDLAWVTAVAVCVGVGVALVHTLAQGHVQAEIRQLQAHIDKLAGESPPKGPFRSDAGLEGLSLAIESCVSGLRRRIDQLVAQRRELEIEARITEAQRCHTEAIFNSITDAVLVTDAFNEVALANDAAARILSFDLQRAHHTPVDRLVADPVLCKLIKDTREGGVAGRRRHVEHRLGGTGDPTVYDVTLAGVTDARSTRSADETVGVVTILRDITREKAIAEMKSEFVSNVSHELRTPLSSIKAYLEMLVDGEAQDEQTRSEFYNVIQGEANRLSRLIDNILNINRIESGVVKVQREHLSLSELIREAIEVMRPQARAKNIELAEVSSPLFFQVFADKDMIQQTVINLLGNAVKYTLPGGKITISVGVDERERMVDVSVADTGVGIPPADLPFLFSKFYRVAEHKKLAPGTGLGLNLVKNIVETVHAGKVSVFSEVGKGSTFTFSLPMADSVM